MHNWTAALAQISIEEFSSTQYQMTGTSSVTSPVDSTWQLSYRIPIVNSPISFSRYLHARTTNQTPPRYTSQPSAGRGIAKSSCIFVNVCRLSVAKLQLVFTVTRRRRSANNDALSTWTTHQAGSTHLRTQCCDRTLSSLTWRLRHSPGCPWQRGHVRRAGQVRRTRDVT